MEAQRNRWLACATHPRNAPPCASPSCGQTGIWKRVQRLTPLTTLKWGRSQQPAMCRQWAGGNFEQRGHLFLSTASQHRISHRHVPMSLQAETLHPSFIEGYTTWIYLVFTAEWGSEQKHPKEHAGFVTSCCLAPPAKTRWFAAGDQNQVVANKCGRLAVT